jgi:hypothetical protein
MSAALKPQRAMPPGRGGKGKPVTGMPSLWIGQHGKIARKYLGGGCGWRSVCFATPML